MSTQQDFKKYATKHRRLTTLCLDSYVKQTQNMTRTVIEERNKPFREIDVYSMLMKERTIFLGSEINNPLANTIVAQFLYLASIDRRKPIKLYINSPGGSITAGLAIYDTMNLIAPHVETVGIGLAASMGAVLLAGGQAKKRSILPHARVMIHQPIGGFQGQAKDMEINLQQILNLKKELYKILAKHTKQPFQTIEKDSDRDYWMGAHQAVAYGMVDQVLT